MANHQISIDRREFVTGMAAALSLAGRSRAEPSPPRRPNLLYVFADQLGFHHLGVNGAKQAQTPNIDGLARAGVNFVNAVSTMPVCAAHRASLLTGKYPTTTGMVINELRMNPHHTTIAHVLARAGYDVEYIGKWHLWANQLGNHTDPHNSFVPPGPDRLGFDGYFAHCNFNHEYFNASYHLDSPKRLSYGDGVYEPDGQTGLAIARLERAAKSGRPHALFLSLGTPHDPWLHDNVPGLWLDRFQDQDFPHPANFSRQNDPYADLWGMYRPGEHPRLPEWRRIYYAMTANIDWNIGRLLAALDRLGLARDTVAAFSSDHGEMFGAHGRRAKNIFYEEAARVPLLVRYPSEVPEGMVCDACISTVDLMPTLLGLLGLTAPAEVEGIDLSARARGNDGPEPEAAFMQNLGACAAFLDGYEWRSARDKRYTYAVYRKDGRELLFDNLEDPLQLRDLARDRTEVRKRLHDFLRSKMDELNDEFPSCTWCREHWTKDRIILRGAKG